MKTTRRKFLGSAGGIVSLPFLESILPRSAWAQDNKPAQRFIVYYVPNGRNQDTFRPGAAGPLGTLPRALAPLDGMKDYLTVLTNFKDMTAPISTSCDHAKAAGPSLTGMPLIHPMKAENGISIDQQIVKSLNLSTQFKSLQWTAAKAGVGDCGSAAFYSQAISWADVASPLSPLNTPLQAFNQLFAGYDPAATEAQKAFRLQAQKSVLDFVQKDAKSLEARMNKADKVKLDEYFTGVRDIERRVSIKTNSCASEPPNPPNNKNHPDTVKAFNDLMTLAIKCDMTRVITFMLEYEVSYRVYEFLFPGQNSPGHHSLSHFGSDAKMKEQLVQVETWETTMFLDLANKLKAIPEGDGNVLDNTVLCLWAGMGQGDNHDHDSVAIAMLGKAGGKLNPGQHINGGGQAVGNIHVSLLNAMGVKTEKFGQFGTKTIDGLVKA